MDEDETTTRSLAGPVGHRLADTLIEKVTGTIDNFPHSDAKQRAAIARLIADSLYDYSEEQEQHG